MKEVVENRRSDEYYVLVTRYVPMEIRRRALKIKDVFDRWDRDVAPSRELLKQYKVYGSWANYLEAFRKEVPLVLLKRKMQTWKQDARGKTVVLVCVEEEEEYPKCHTWILLDMAKELEEVPSKCPMCGGKRVPFPPKPEINYCPSCYEKGKEAVHSK